MNFYYIKKSVVNETDEPIFIKQEDFNPEVKNE
jgi:hypothetical protein